MLSYGGEKLNERFRKMVFATILKQVPESISHFLIRYLHIKVILGLVMSLLFSRT